METKTCNVCQEAKPISEFYKRTSTDKPRHQCKSCQNKRALKSYHKDKTVHQKAAHKFNLKRYGLTPESYKDLLEKQGGCCAICGVDTPTVARATAKYFSVDHCHDTGRVRGLLCCTCNAGLGMLKDSRDMLRRALEYLDR